MPQIRAIHWPDIAATNSLGVVKVAAGRGPERAIGDWGLYPGDAILSWPSARALEVVVGAEALIAANLCRCKQCHRNGRGNHFE